MGKLIDTNVLMTWFNDNCDVDEDVSVVRVLGIITEQPETIVRCKDCKHRYEDDCPMRFAEVVEVDDDEYIDHEILYHDNTTDDGYCDCAERRADE